MKNIILNDLIKRHPALSPVKDDIERAYLILKGCCDNGGRIFVCGNGGSSSDAEHIVGELLKSFKKKRPIDEKIKKSLSCLGDEAEMLGGLLEGALPAYSLNSQTAIMTAFANDCSWDAVFAQQLYGLGKSGDCLIALSTSGNSKNCAYAVLLAKAMGISTISLTGMGGGKMKALSDCTVAVPEVETYKVQELHLPVYHYVCEEIEKHFFG